jgi:hypothetical protein
MNTDPIAEAKNLRGWEEHPIKPASARPPDPQPIEDTPTFGNERAIASV